MDEINADFYDDDYYVMQTSKELTERTLPFIQKIDIVGKKVLEIGCGSGQYLRTMDKAKLVMGFDYSRSAIGICRGHGMDNVFLGSADRVAVKGGFDTVLLIDVVEHLYPEQFERCVEDVDRVLVRGGIVAIKTPCKDIIPRGIRDWYNKVRGFPSQKRGEGHVNEMSVREVVRAFKKMGFVVEMLDVINTSRHKMLKEMLGFGLGGNIRVILRKI